jgi:signal transduction histidine kinase
MNTETIPLINLPAFGVGIALYALLLFMVLRHRRSRVMNAAPEATIFDWRLLATALCGLCWNAGEFVELGGRAFFGLSVSPFFSATACAALGFLPAFVVHSAWTEKAARQNFSYRFLISAAYFLSSISAVWQIAAAATVGRAPAIAALRLLTVGYLLILAGLFFLNFRQPVERKAIWATALAVFAVSALHLGQTHETESFWLAELVGHQASLPLAFAILLQDFRFAFADLFLKRALSLILLTAASFGLFSLAVAVWQRETTGATLGLMITTALIYPFLHRCAVLFVDKILLRRADYERLKIEIKNRVAALESEADVLAETAERLKTALTARSAFVEKVFSRVEDDCTVNLKPNAAEILVPTAEKPAACIVLREFAGGRRLLSDEIAMLSEAATAAARRIDVLRVTHERCEQELREQEFGKLATEAKLRALRAQINPHFLFNALTTIGYLIQTAPDKALNTLLRLTQLLRGALRSGSEFQTLGDELKLIESYLEIERARFEERLLVEIKAAPELLNLRIPALILQPLVENAVKHGITPKKAGGKIVIEAAREAENLVLRVIDTGAGIEPAKLTENRLSRVGLNNVEQRLRLHYNNAARLSIKTAAGNGTTVEIQISDFNFQIFDIKSKI